MEYQDPYAGVPWPAEEPGYEGKAVAVAEPRTPHNTGAIRVVPALPIGHYAAQAAQETALRHEHGSAGLTTSLETLNPYLGEMFAPGKVAVIAAASGVAKTTLMAQLAVEFAEGGVPSFLASMEDDGVDCAKRMLANVGNGHVGQIRSGFRDHLGNRQAVPAEFDQAVHDLAALPLHLASEPMSIVELALAVYNWRQGWGAGETFGVVLIDQLSHILPDDPALWRAKFPHARPMPGRGASDAALYQWQMVALRAVARQFGVCIIVAHQLNDNLDDAGKPTLQSMRGSRGINHEANTVLVAHRPTRLPNPAAGPGEPKTVANETGRMWLLCLKYREGATFEIEVAWQGEHQRIADLGAEFTTPRATVRRVTAETRRGMAALTALRTSFEQHQTAAAEAAATGAPLPAAPAAPTLGQLGARWSLPAAPTPAASVVKTSPF